MRLLTFLAAAITAVVATAGARAGVTPLPCATPGLAPGSTGLTPSAAGTLIPGSADRDDDAFSLPTPPFPLRFDGSAYTAATVSTNGVLQFGAGLVNTSFGNGPLPSSAFGAAVFAFWDDLLTFTGVAAGNGIYTNVAGTAPNRVFEVRWQVCHINDPLTPFSFSVLFFENPTQPDFVIAYSPAATALSRGSSATIGVQSSGAAGSTFSNVLTAVTPGLNLRAVCAASNISYQGRLVNAGAAADGNFDLSFTYVNAAGTVLLPAVLRPGTPVSNGVFTVLLPTPTELGTGNVFLRIAVNGTVLSPDQPVAAAPTANFAYRVQTADTARAAFVANTATSAETLAPGRARIRGDAGAAGNSPGIWFASPIAAPIDRAFVGQLNDANVGFFNSGWHFLVNANGNTVLGDGTGAAPPERLTVNGSVQINTGTVVAPTRLAFGPIGDEGNSAENSDAVYFARANTAVDVTELRLIIGDNAAGAGLDSLRVCTTSTGGGLIERFRLQSDGQALKLGGGAWGVLSDPRAKHDVAPLAGTLEKLLNLRGYSFLYNDDRVAAGLAMPGTQIGLMADEVARVFPDWVSTDASGTRYVTERATTALMVEALRDLRAEKDAVAAAAQKQIDGVRAENAELRARLAAIEAALKQMSKDKH